MKFKYPTKATTAIIAIVILEALAIWKGIDGALFGIAIAAITGLGGYVVGIAKKPK